MEIKDINKILELFMNTYSQITNIYKNVSDQENIDKLDDERREQAIYAEKNYIRDISAHISRLNDNRLNAIWSKYKEFKTDDINKILAFEEIDDLTRERVMNEVEKVMKHFLIENEKIEKDIIQKRIDKKVKELTIKNFTKI